MKTELIATGSELVNGDVINTNTAFLASELKKIGVEVYYHTIVKDSFNDLQNSVQTALNRSNLIIITGGLGPTTDDLTKTAVAGLLDLKLEIDKVSLDKIKEFFHKRNRIMPESNIQQALIPEGGIVLENNLGTAPGMVIENGDKTIVLLPGPPFEMKPMFIEKVKPYLIDKYKDEITNNVFTQRIMKLSGVGESQIQDLVKKLNIDEEVEIGYRAKSGQILIKLSVKGQGGKEKVINAEKLIAKELKDYIYSFDDRSLEELIGEKLLKKKLKIGVAESCTGGLINHKLTNVPGSSGYLSHGIVSYSNEAKKALLKVSPATLDMYSAVSQETALEMAKGVKDILNVDIGMSVTGYAGGSVSNYQSNNEVNKDTKEQVGQVFIGLVTDRFEEVKKFYFTGDRLTIKEMAAQAGLFLLWKYLANIN